MRRKAGESRKQKDKNRAFYRTKRLQIVSNNNVIVVGSSGTGKTHNFLKPNILQCNTNMVISDAKGTLFKECGHVLERNGYTIKILNLQDLSRSMRYNPFHYIENEVTIQQQPLG